MESTLKEDRKELDSKSERSVEQGKEASPESSDIIEPEEFEKLPPQVKKIVREFGFSMMMQRSSGFPPQLLEKIEKEHISKSLDLAEKDDERHYKYATQGRVYNLVYVLIAVGIFIFLTFIFGKTDTEFYKKIVETLLIFGAGLGTGYGLKSYKDRRNGK